MNKIKNYYLSFLNENIDNFSYIDSDSIDEITNISMSKEFNFIKIDFNTTYGKSMNIVINYDDFLSWYSKNRDSEHPFKSYIKKFIISSKETEPFLSTMNEIIDDSGNIMPSTDLPNGANNRMVGDKIKWDLEKVYQSSIPKGIRFYSGDLGIGLITW